MRHRSRDKEAGSVSLELAVIFPAVLLLIVAAVQAGLVFHARHLAQAAAQEALRATRVEAGTTAAGRQAATGLLSSSAGDLLAGRQISIVRSPTEADVSITGHAISLFPGITLTVSAKAAGPVERFTTP